MMARGVSTRLPSTIIVCAGKDHLPVESASSEAANPLTAAEPESAHRRIDRRCPAAATVGQNSSHRLSELPELLRARCRFVSQRVRTR